MRVTSRPEIPSSFDRLAADEHFLDRHTDFESLTDDQFVRRFLEPAMWRVLDFPETAWWGHLQFMFAAIDLIRPRRFVELGSHHGTSFFAANQAAQRAGITMEALAVDSWEGEQHTGEYDDSVYHGFVDVLQHRKYDNAHPLKMYFDEAVEMFAPASIDLLHIDGLHTLEAVQHDYDMWIDKVVPGGLILFHDINVHQKDFGVWRLWKDLEAEAEAGRSFAFSHSHGLGVLQKPGSAFPQLTRLLRILDQDDALASFTQLVLETVSELAHLASKLPLTQKVATEHRDKRVAAEAEVRSLRESVKRYERQLATALADKDQMHADRDHSVTREGLHLARLTAVEDSLKTMRSDLRQSFEAAERANHRANTEARRAEKASNEAARSIKANHNLRIRNEQAKSAARRASLETRLARAESSAAKSRLQAELDQSLQLVNAQIAQKTAAPNLARRIVRKAKGVPTRPDALIDLQTVRARVSEDIFAAELEDSGLFDDQHYTQNYPDVAGYADGPLRHFVRHGRFEGRQPNEFFDPEVYKSRNVDVADSGIDPTEHYLRYGAFELRQIGDTFDSPGYLLAYQDVANAGGNPLGHYLRYGRDGGRSPQPKSQQGTSKKSKRRHKAVDRAVDRETTNRLLTSYNQQRAEIDDTLVSIVMPTYNRAGLLPRAVSSVQAQTHQKWELIIIDDGSTDHTPEVIDQFSRDSRIRVIWNDHGGVSAARNAGLDAAEGNLIAFLDTDNEWTPEYLRLMLTHFADTGVSSAYAGMVVRDEHGKVSSYLSSEFDWDACYEGNYVDMNVFMHRHDRTKGSLRFETQLRRMVDWDYILRMTKAEPASHAPFVGCYYYDAPAGDSRISKSEPMIYREMVRKRNDPTVDQPPSFSELANDLVLEFAIRISAPWAKRHVWGDTHYALALQKELEALGHRARIVYQDDGEKLSRGPIDEVNLVLRGLTPHGPVPNGLNILWVISHPESVSTSEMAEYNIVYLASESHAALVQHDPLVDPQILMQATAFSPTGPDRPTEGVVFVGNSRKVERPIVQWAAEEELDLRLYGGDWENTSAAPFCLGTSYPNELLAELYGSADIVLNDHWESMRDFGYISNRVFDVLAANGTVASDPMPAIDRFFGEAVRQVTNPTGLRDAAATPLTAAQRQASGEAVRSDHGFAMRARQIVNDVFEYLRLDVPFDPTERSATPWRTGGETRPLKRPVASLTNSSVDDQHGQLKIGALFMPTRLGYQSSAFIRVLAPLTTDANFSQARVVATADPQRLAVHELDAVVIGRTALADHGAAKLLLQQAKDNEVPVVVDIDDSFESITPGTDAYELYQPRLAALRHVVAEADAVTVSTLGIAEAFGIVDDPRTHIVANTLDPRLWRRYPRPDQIVLRSPDAPLRVLYMGTATHDDDFDVVVDALDEWAETEDFELTIIGAVRNPPQRPWLQRIDAPRGAGLYPRFAHWLVEQPSFDIGIAPLQDTEFNAGKSDIKFLDYCAIGAIPVLSDVTAYSGDSHQSELAYHAKNDTTSWVEALASAATEVRGGAATTKRQEWLWEHRNADQAGAELLKIIASARDTIDLADSKPNQPPVSAV